MRFPAGARLFCVLKNIPITQAPAQLPVQSVPTSIPRPGHEADHSLPNTAEVKNEWIYTFTPAYAFVPLLFLPILLYFNHSDSA